TPEPGWRPGSGFFRIAATRRGKVSSLEMESEVATLRSQLDRFRALASNGSLGRSAPEVSGWSIAEHVDHCLKSSRAILARINDPRPCDGGINFVGRLVLLTGWIPRGRGKSPEKMRGGVVTGGEVAASLRELEAVVAAFTPEAMSCRAPVVRHPYFGGLDPRQALRFTIIHNRHHLRIIDDITGR
ncbi:MAG TPA: DinB family protein, partial [Thermoanaerobaculia bacterium]|nr:DinB family protein [Thermoanaerobaculia bacterium]